MTVEILMAAKLEIGVFLLAALLHFLLFSTRAPGPKALFRAPFRSLLSGAQGQSREAGEPCCILGPRFEAYGSLRTAS